MRGPLGGEGRKVRNRAAEHKKKTMKTNKQNKTNKQEDRTSLVSELQNRTEQLVKAPESETEEQTEAQPEQPTGHQTTSVKPYVNFAEREHTRNLPVEKVLEKLGSKFRLAQAPAREREKLVQAADELFCYIFHHSS
jgi:hypothetical protein